MTTVALSPLERFKRTRPIVEGLRRHHGKLSNALLRFDNAMATLRAQRDPFVLANGDSIESVSSGINRHLDSIERTVSNVDAVNEKISEARAAQGAGFGFWQYLVVLALLLAGKAAAGVGGAVDQHFRDRDAMQKQLADLKKRCAAGQATPQACSEIAALEAALASGPIETIGLTLQHVLYWGLGFYVLSLVVRTVRK